MKHDRSGGCPLVPHPLLRTEWVIAGYSHGFTVEVAITLCSRVGRVHACAVEVLSALAAGTKPVRVDCRRLPLGGQRSRDCDRNGEARETRGRVLARSTQDVAMEGTQPIGLNRHGRVVLHPVAICASGCWARSNRKLLWGEYTGSTELPRVLRVVPAVLPGAPNQPLATRVTGVAANTHIVCVSGGHSTIESHHDSEPIDLRPFRAVQQVAAGPNHPNCALELKSALQFEISIRGQIRHAIYAGKRCCLKSEQTQAQEGAHCHDGAQAHGA